MSTTCSVVIKKSVSSGSLLFPAPTWYHNLPVKVLVNIFKYFNENELLTCIIPVCQQWRYAALKPELWRKLEIYGQDVPTKFICDKIRSLKFLESVYFEDISDPTAVIRQICRCNPYLLHITLRHCPDVHEKVLLYLIRTCRGLETVDIGGTECKGENFFLEVCTLQELRSVNFSNNPHLTTRNLLSVALNCHNLQELRLSNYTSRRDSLRDEDAAFIVSNLCDNLITLTIDASTLSNNAYQAIQGCYKLKKLGIYNANTMSGEYCMDLWRNFPELTALKVRHAHQVAGKHIQELFTSGRLVFNKLTHLDFTGCWKITDNGLDAVAKCCSELEEIILKSCKSLKNISAVCDLCSKIRLINVAFCVNLDPNCILPVRRNYRKVVVDESPKHGPLITELKNANVKVYLHFSEYNRRGKKL